MDSSARTEAFISLGAVLRGALDGNGKWSGKLNAAIENQHIENPWFIPRFARLALDSVASVLIEENIVKWVSQYQNFSEKRESGRVLIVMAGNIPLAGFHDFMSVLIAGHTVIAKTSSKDGSLIYLISEILCDIEKRFREKIYLYKGEPDSKVFDAVIATGSNNTARYFEYYFGKYPHIIRKNRNSAAILTGRESNEELARLGLDVFSYFGLGCRNISKILVPAGFDLSSLTELWKEHSFVINHSKYASNYDYNKAVFLVNREKFTDTGYLLLRENNALASPVAVLHFEFYNDYREVKNMLSSLSESLQCICGEGYLPYGTSQVPQLWDYADGKDTLDFLLKKISSGIM